MGVTTLENQVTDPLQVARTVRSASIGLHLAQTGFYSLETGRPVAKFLATPDLALRAATGEPTLVFNQVIAYGQHVESRLVATMNEWRRMGFTLVCVNRLSETDIEWRPW